MAFMVGRDTTVFTTKRVLSIDVQGWSGKRIEYKSIPYTSIQAFSVESAGSWDRDAEMKLYCQCYWGPVFKQDFRKGKADIIAIQNFIAAQVIGHDDGASTGPTVSGGSEGTPGGVTAFLQWLGDDAHMISQDTMEKELRETVPILQRDEKVDLCFRVLRDMCVFTTKRMIIIDVQGWSGKKVEYFSIPLKHLFAFEVNSAGSIAALNSAKVRVYTAMPGMDHVTQDLSRSESNFWSIHTFLSQKMLGGGGGGKGSGKGGYSSTAGPSNEMS